MALKPAYFAKEAASNIRRNLLMTVVAVCAVALSLMFLGGVLMLGKVVDNITRRWQDDVVINVFLLPDASQAQIATAQETITEYKEVEDVKFVSKQAAYEEFREMFQHEEELVENVDADTLPASFRISLEDPDTLDTVSARMEKLEGVDEVISAKEQVEQVQKLLRIFAIAIVVIGVVILAAAIVLISNTIRLAIFARRKEIAIMKLVGATNWFIRWPFLLEGLIQGFAGAAIAGGFLWIAREVGIEWINDKLLFLPLGIPNAWMIVVFLAVGVIGIGVATGGTFVALRRYLEV